MIYHAEIAKKGLYFNMIEVDVEQIFLSSEDILFQVKRGQVEQAQIEIMRSVDHRKSTDSTIKNQYSLTKISLDISAEPARNTALGGFS